MGAPHRNRFRPFALLLGAALLAACAAPVPSSGQHAGTGSMAAAPNANTGATVPPEPSQDRAGAGAAVVIDTSCRTDADCTVKNVGNCCGYYPACVNVNSPTDPAGVQARCAQEAMASVCGFPAITACTCRQGRCEAESGEIVQ